MKNESNNEPSATGALRRVKRISEVIQTELVEELNELLKDSRNGLLMRWLHEGMPRFLVGVYGPETQITASPDKWEVERVGKRILAAWQHAGEYSLPETLAMQKLALLMPPAVPEEGAAGPDGEVVAQIREYHGRFSRLFPAGSFEPADLSDHTWLCLVAVPWLLKRAGLANPQCPPPAADL